MGARWNRLGFRLLSLLALIFASPEIRGCWSVNDEGSTSFRDVFGFWIQHSLFLFVIVFNILFSFRLEMKE